MTEQERISQIEHSLADLERQLYDLKFEVRELKNTRQTTGQAAVSPTVSDIPDTKTNGVNTSTTGTVAKAMVPAASVPEHPAPVQPAPAPVSKAVQKPVQPQKSTAKQKNKASSRFEENLGGKVMGIVAAILVFIGLFLFGSMLYERLGDTARIAILFIVSFLLLGAGLFLERKRKSWFTASLVGCGFGAIYISLFITALYFKRFDAEVLYVLLMLWLAGIGLYVFRRRSFTTALLGQIGIAFSVIFGCIGIESAGRFTFLCVYFTVFSLLYLWIVLWRFLPDTEKKPYSWIHLTAVGLNMVQLWCLAGCYVSVFGTRSENAGKGWTAGILLCFYCLVLPLFFLLRQRLMAKLPLLPSRTLRRKINEETFPVYKAGPVSIAIFATQQIITWVVFCLIAESLFEADVPIALFLLLGLMASYLITQFFGPTGTEAKGTTIITAAAVCFSLMYYDMPLLLSVLILMLFCAVTALFGIFGSECPLRSVLNANTHRWEYLCKEEKGRCFDKFTACAYLPFIIFSFEFGDEPFILLLITIFVAAFFGGTFIFLFRDGRDHRFGNSWKAVLYLAGMLSVFWISGCFFSHFDMEDLCLQAVVVTVLTACNSIVFYSGFRKKLGDPNVTEPVVHLFVRLVHSVIWIWGITLLHDGSMNKHPLLCVWLILLTIYLCGSGMYEQYKLYRNKTGLGIYFGFRITIYLLLILAAFDNIPGYVISCILLVLAILFILAGFPLRLAPLRIYGLCLAMLAVIKLMMIDVEHDNSMETVLCFLGAGILCFAINFIYNHVKKRFKNDTE